jgi:hypothetical protein
MKREDTSGAAHEDCGRASRDAVQHTASREKGDFHIFIEHLKTQHNHFVIDDDDSGEVADVVRS